ncbi:MAG: hypothetical protein ACSHWW_14000 [Nonlabens sp.]|uniref:hypothetical protein n=1 Tax=Nonlabens sp. TaxID=1888209 RepID=UPI003EF986A6
MIISPDFITWLITGSTIDDKTILKLAKLQGFEISESLRKNLSNCFHQKHNPSQKTVSNIKYFFKELITIDSFQNEIDQLDISLPIKISTTEETLSYLESSYALFFEAAKLENGFLNIEVKNIFRFLLYFSEQEAKGVAPFELESILLKDELFQNFDPKNDRYIKHSVKGVIRGQFSLNLLLYLCACMELELDKEWKDHSIFQSIFDKLIPDIKNMKSPFYYLVSLIKDFAAINGNKLSNEKISEILDIEPKSFTRYIQGTRKVHVKHMRVIIHSVRLAYFYIIFWRNLLEIISKDNELLFIDCLNKYQKYRDIALKNYEKFEVTLNKNEAQ